MIDTTLLKTNLKQLSEAMGVSGAEHEVRKLILDAIRDKALDIEIDAMGNITAFRKGNDQSNLKVMVATHMDEKGFMVTKIGDDGLISVSSVGRHDGRFLPASRVQVGKAKIPGVTLWAPIHMNREYKILGVDALAIDVGAENKGGVSAKIGERIGFLSTYTEISDIVVRGKAFDSRAGCAALIDLINGAPLPFDLRVAFTAQHHVGQRGVQVAGYRLKPQVAFILVGVDCNDLPRESDDDRTQVIRLGGGPVIVAMDRLHIPNRKLADHVINVAKAKNIPHQFQVIAGDYSNAGRLSEVRDGMPTVTIAVPIRYANSPNALLNLTDLENTIHLLREALSALTPDSWSD